MSKKLAGLIVLGLASATPAFAAGQAEAKGLVEDSSLNVLLRNAFINRDYKGGRHDSGEWGQGAIANFESGFTQGTVGFGVDAFAAYAVRLDGSRDRAGNWGIDFFKQDSTGMPEKDVAKGGASLKLRFSNTVLAYGDLRPNLPVLSHDNSRLLPESYTGTMLTSTEIEGLEFNAGTFHAQSRKSDEGRDSGGLKGIDVIGASYKFNDAFSGAFYASDVEDVLKRQYLNLNYVLPIASNSLTFDFNGYRTKQEEAQWRDRDPLTRVAAEMQKLGQITDAVTRVVGMRGHVSQVQPAQHRLGLHGSGGVGGRVGECHRVPPRCAAIVWIHGRDGVSDATRAGSRWAQESSEACIHTSPCSISTRRAAVIATPSDPVCTCSTPQRSTTTYVGTPAVGTRNSTGCPPGATHDSTTSTCATTDLPSMC